MSSDVPSLMEAIELGQARRDAGRSPFSTSSRSSRSSASIDLLGVVLRYSVQQSPSVDSFSSMPRAEIWITDQSVGNNSNQSILSVRVTLSGSAEISRIMEEQITQGDIVRFNRVSLHRSDANNAQFLHSWKDPEAGMKWFRLGHVDRLGSFANTSGERGSSSSRRIPSEMSTSPDRLENLAHWFSLYRAAGNGENGLTPLPCQRRTLNEIMASAGLLSNVVVRITEYDCKPSTPSSASTRKRRRTSPGTPSSTLNGFATLSDQSGAVLLLIDPGNLLGSSLRIAKDSGKAILLTSVASKAGSDVQELQRSLPSDEVVLVPTRSSSAVVLSDEEILTTTGNNNEYTQDYTPTQIPGMTRTQNTETKEVVGRLEDLWINGKSVLQGRTLSSWKEFKATMIDTSDGRYLFNEGTVRISQLKSTTEAGDEVEVDGSSLTHEYTVNADTIRTLCGGANESDIFKTSAVGSGAGMVLKALLTNRTILRWTIVKDMSLGGNDTEQSISKVAVTKL